MLRYANAWCRNTLRNNDNGLLVAAVARREHRKVFQQQVHVGVNHYHGGRRPRFVVAAAAATILPVSRTISTQTAAAAATTTNSSSSSSSWSQRELTRDPKTLRSVTNFVLNPRRNPLASMDYPTSWDDTVAIMTAWLEQQGRHPGRRQQPGQSVALSGRSVDTVERLFQRLWAEQATSHRGLAASHPHRERELILARWHAIILDAWIRLCQQQSCPEMIAVTAARAEATLGRIVEWYNQGGCWVLMPTDATSSSGTSIHEDPLPVSSFALLVTEWLRAGTLDGTIRAVDLLLTWTEGADATSLLERHKVEITACFNQTVQQCNHLLQRQQQQLVNMDYNFDGGDGGRILSQSVTALAARIDTLRDYGGWDDLEELSVLARKIALVESLQQQQQHHPSTPTDDSNTSTVYEETALFEEMTRVIDRANESDYDTIVNRVIPRIMISQNIPTKVAADISAALTDFFVRMNHPPQATKWLQQWDQITTSFAVSLQPKAKEATLMQLPLQRFLSVFDLWAAQVGGDTNHQHQHHHHNGAKTTATTKSNDEAIWRADEIFQRCQQLLLQQQLLSSSSSSQLQLPDHNKSNGDGVLESSSTSSSSDPLLEAGVYSKLFQMWANSNVGVTVRARKVRAMLKPFIRKQTRNDPATHNVLLDGLDLVDVKWILKAITVLDSEEEEEKSSTNNNNNNNKSSNKSLLGKDELTTLVTIVRQKWGDTTAAAASNDDNHNDSIKVLEDILGPLVEELVKHEMTDEMNSLLTAFGLMTDETNGTAIQEEEEEEDKSSSQQQQQQSSVRLLPREQVLRCFLPHMNAKSRLDLIRKLGGLIDEEEEEEEDAAAAAAANNNNNNNNRTDNGWNIRCYEAAISALFLSDYNRDKESFAAAKHLLEDALDRIVDDTLPGGATSSESIRSLIETAVFRSTWGTNKEETDARAAFALTLLRSAEAKLLSMDPQDPIRERFPSSPISVSAFHHVMVKLCHAKQKTEATDLYVRWMAYHQKGGYSDLLPERRSFTQHMGNVYTTRSGKELEAMLHEWVNCYKQTNNTVLDEKGMPDQKIYEQILGAYRREKDVTAALEFVEGQLQAARVGEADVQLASPLLDRAIGLVSSECDEKLAFQLIIKKLFLTHVMDEEWKVDDLDVFSWRRILSACLSPPREERSVAVKSAIMAMAEIRKAGKADIVAYGLFAGVIRNNLRREYNRGIRIGMASAAFESCCEDGYLNESLRDQFKILVGAERWSEIYSSKLLPNGEEPAKWRQSFGQKKRSGQLPQANKA